MRICKYRGYSLIIVRYSLNLQDTFRYERFQHRILKPEPSLPRFLRRLFCAVPDNSDLGPTPRYYNCLKGAFPHLTYIIHKYMARLYLT